MKKITLKTFLDEIRLSCTDLILPTRDNPTGFLTTASKYEHNIMYLMEYTVRIWLIYKTTYSVVKVQSLKKENGLLTLHFQGTWFVMDATDFLHSEPSYDTFEVFLASNTLWGKSEEDTKQLNRHLNVPGQVIYLEEAPPMLYASKGSFLYIESPPTAYEELL